MKRTIALASGVVVAAVAAIAGTASAAGGALPTLPLNLNGKTITAPTTFPAGAVDIVATVTSKRGDPILVRLDPGVTFAQAFAAVGAARGDTNALQGLAAIVYDRVTPHGMSSTQTVLTPGSYVALDTNNNDPRKWPIAPFTVTQNSAPAALPKAAATVKEQEFRFVGPSTFHVGELVRFENAGYLAHMTDGVGVKDKKTALKVASLLHAGKDKQIGRLAQGFVSFFEENSPGGMQQETIGVKPGWYVLACFDATQDGREHTSLGMEKVIHITR